MTKPHVHTFYRVWFTWVDPITLFFTVLGCIFAPGDALELLVPSFLSPFQPLQAALIHQTAALYGFMAIMFGVLLRISPDPKVWRVVQAATLFVDISLLVTMYFALKLQGRLETDKWRGIEWFNSLFTIWVAVVRIAFLMGVGGEDGSSANAKKIR
ncbi:Nn.00g043220.m01.CDS01 [Neocucurbitaria sp. VM-36]